MIGVAACLAAATPGAAQKTERDDLSAAVGRAVQRGELLYFYDRAAWLGTDDFRERFPDLLSQAAGYVVSGDRATTSLAFFDKSQSKAIYRATFSGGRLLKNGPPAADVVALTSLEKQLISAKEKALLAFQQAEVELCSEASPNLAAIPSNDRAGAVLVYLMTPQTEPRSYPLGGHYSVKVWQDGTVSQVRRFTNTCIAMDSGQVRDGAKPVGYGMTHLLDPTPTEIHVFTSIASRMPIYVGTKNKRTWVVEGNKIRSMNPK